MNLKTFGSFVDALGGSGLVVNLTIKGSAIGQISVTSKYDDEKSTESNPVFDPNFSFVKFQILQKNKVFGKEFYTVDHDSKPMIIGKIEFDRFDFTKKSNHLIEITIGKKTQKVPINAILQIWNDFYWEQSGMADCSIVREGFQGSDNTVEFTNSDRAMIESLSREIASSSYDGGDE